MSQLRLSIEVSPDVQSQLVFRMPITETTKGSSISSPNSMIQESQDIQPITSSHTAAVTKNSPPPISKLEQPQDVEASTMPPPSQAPTPNDSIASTKSEGLTSMPAELLLKVLSDVPLSSYLDLAHTSKGLRSFIKTNAAMICNMVIRSRFPMEAQRLEVTTEARNARFENREGWLLPATGKLEEQEQLFLLNSRDTHHRYWVGCQKCPNFGGYIGRPCAAGPQRRHAEGISHYSLLGTHWKEEDSSIENNLMHFGVAGPHFLYLLEKDALIENPSQYPEWTYEAKYPCQDGDFTLCMGSFNFRVVKIENGLVVRRYERFPRELVWYFGVDNLICNSELRS